MSDGSADDREPRPRTAAIPEPRSWRNWQAVRTGTLPSQIVEMRLYSDAWFVAEAYGFGPYSFLNPVASTRRGSMYDLKPGVVLRVGLALLPEAGVPLVTSDDHYHGGNLFDEVTALASLLLEARLVAGPIDREFGDNGDPLGRPRAHDASYVPLLPTTNQAPQIPRLAGQRDLRHLADLATFPLLSPAAATALIKAARLYQNALWIADSAPETAWLLLVSAVETAANQWDREVATPAERLAATFPSLVSLLVKHEREALVPKVARILKGIIGSTGKFVGFLQAFAPGPPDARPRYGQFDFAPDNRTAAIKQVYKLRSRALHDGTPFPFPMCHPPDTFDGVAEEVPTGLGAGALGATWAVADTPMLLHFFAYLTRGALLNWWRTLVPVDAKVDDPPFSEILREPAGPGRAA